MTHGSQSWLDVELSGGVSVDERLGKRMRIRFGRQDPSACPSAGGIAFAIVETESGQGDDGRNDDSEAACVRLSEKSLQLGEDPFEEIEIG